MATSNIQKSCLKQLYLIRHAKSSWSDSSLADFDRPLNGRGKRDGPLMARRLGSLNFIPDIMVSSPARRALKTAKYIAKGVGYSRKEIVYNDSLYLGSLNSYLHLIESLKNSCSTLFLVGHNYTITELGEFLTGQYLGNIPTSGVVAIDYDSTDGFSSTQGTGTLLFFDFPKNTSWSGYH